MKTGLVLGGGGSKGAYEIGVWRALQELQMPIDFVCGASIGALNGALIAQQDYELAKHLWRNISISNVFVEEEVLPFDLDRLMAESDRILKVLRLSLTNKGSSNANLEHFVRTNIDLDKVYHSSIELGVVVFNVDERKGEEWSIQDIAKEDLVDYLVASASCFPALQMKDIHGVRYMDGGYYDNVPVAFAKRKGCERIIAVNLRSAGILNKKGFSEEVIWIEPAWSLGSFLTFEPTLAMHNFQLGYLDAMKVLGPYSGSLYTFSGESASDLQRFEALVEESLESFKKSLNRYERMVVEGLLTMRRSRIKDANFAQHVVEQTARIFKISPLQVYDFEAFMILLLKAFNQTAHSSLEEEENSLSLKRLRREEIVKRMYHRIVLQHDYSSQTYALSLAFVDESVGAICIDLMQRYFLERKKMETKPKK